MTKEQEDFDRTRRRLYALADKLGMRITIIVRRKNPAAPAKAPQREPGDE